MTARWTSAREPRRQTRCELDHRDGGVCLRRLQWDGTCPGEDDHSPWVDPNEVDQ